MPDPSGELPQKQEGPKLEGQEPRILNPEKSGLIKEALTKVDFIEGKTRLIKLKGTNVTLQVAPSLRRLDSSLDNSRPSETGFREISRPVEDVVSSVRSRLSNMSQELDHAGAKNPGGRELIEDILNRAATEQDEQKALELAHSAGAKFNSMAKELEDLSGSQKGQVDIMSYDANEGFQRITYIATNIADSLRRDFQQTWAFEVFINSKNLAQVTEEAKIELSKEDRKLLDESKENTDAFNQIVGQLIKRDVSSIDLNPASS